MRRMSIPMLLTLSCLGVLLLGATSEKAAEPSNDISQYRIIMDRNTFNRFREPVVARPMSTPRPPGPVVPPTPQIPTEYLDLTGVMVAGGTARAFFEGTQYGVAGVFELGDVVAGYRILNVSRDVVSLEKNGARFDLPVGKSLTWRTDKPVSITERELSGYLSTEALSAQLSPPAAASSAVPFSEGGGERDRNSLTTSEFTSRVNEVRSRYERPDDRGNNDSGRNGDSTSGPGSSSPTPAPAVSAADRAELIRKMIERRKQEMEK